MEEFSNKCGGMNSCLGHIPGASNRLEPGKHNLPTYTGYCAQWSRRNSASYGLSFTFLQSVILQQAVTRWLSETHRTESDVSRLRVIEAEVNGVKVTATEVI
eukprot:480483-Amphidinium_carterae.1